MAIELTDVFRAASLIQWGLQPRIRPIQSTEYQDLIREYLNRSEFRDVVAEMSDGLGLYVLNVSEHGIVMSPREESVFWMKASSFRSANSSADVRLLDGLVQITIAATVFPRARDLEDDVNRPRPPVTVEEVDESLRGICDRLKAEFEKVDPATDDIKVGLYDAWRVYDNTLSVKETKDGRESRTTTTRIIKYNLERLKEFGCFTETRYGGRLAWQPTRRYNVLVQELAASRLFDEVMRIKNGETSEQDYGDETPLNDAESMMTAEDAASWGAEFRDASVEVDMMGDAVPKGDALEPEYASDELILPGDDDGDASSEDISDGDASSEDISDGEDDA